MEKETIENIFTFLKTRERKEIPQEWINFKKKDKLIKELENHPNGIQYRYEGNLNLSYSNITKLPNDLYVSGELDLRGCKQLEKLPNNLYVKYSLDIIGCDQLTELPDKLHVGNHLDLRNLQITNLPNELYVGGLLVLKNTPLDNMTEMPTGVKVKQGVLFSNFYLPKGEFKAHEGDLDLSHLTYIEALPKGLHVMGGLNLHNTGIESLPEDLVVDGDLILTETEIFSLPKGLQVGGDLFIGGTNIENYDQEDIEEMIAPGFIKGSIIYYDEDDDEYDDED